MKTTILAICLSAIFNCAIAQNASNKQELRDEIYDLATLLFDDTIINSHISSQIPLCNGIEEQAFCHRWHIGRVDTILSVYHAGHSISLSVQKPTNQITIYFENEEQKILFQDKSNEISIKCFFKEKIDTTGTYAEMEKKYEAEHKNSVLWGYYVPAFRWKETECGKDIIHDFNLNIYLWNNYLAEAIRK